MENLYCDDKYRNHEILILNCQAYTILTDSLIMKNHVKLLEERKEMEKLDLDAEYPYSYEIIKYYALENVKIALALEIHLKSLFLSKKIMIHYVKDKDFLKHQNEGPIYIDEYFQKYNSSNRFNFLKSKSIKPSLMIKNSYSKAIDLDEDICKIIDDFLKQRNSIHLPINLPKGISLSNEKILKLVKYVNENIIDFTYRLADDNHFNKNFRLNKF